MKILMISPVDLFPANNGALVRIAQLFRGLSRFHDTTLVYPVPETENQQVLTDLPKGYSPVRVKLPSQLHRLVAVASQWPYHVRYYYLMKLAESVEYLLSREDFSLVYCHFIYTLPYLEKAEQPIVLDQHNVDREYWYRKVTYYRFNRDFGRLVFAYANYLKTIRFENTWLGRIQGLVSVSKRDSDTSRLFVTNSTTKFIVAPNGVDIQQYSARQIPLKGKEDSLVLGFFGSLDLELNQDAALELCRDILPVVQERLPYLRVSALIVGRNPPSKLIHFAESNPWSKITITGTVEDVLPYLQQIDILVLPLRSGAGTKLRVLEAMASEVCIVGSDLAFGGMDDIEFGKHAYQANTTEEFIEAICSLAPNPALTQMTAGRARELVINRYNWDSITRALSNDLVDLCSDAYWAAKTDTFIRGRQR